MKSVFRIFIGVCIGILALLSFQSKLVFPGAWMRDAKFSAAQIKQQIESLSSKKGHYLTREISEGEHVEAFLFEPPGPTKGLVVFAHGNGELIDDWFQESRLQIINNYTAQGFALLLPEFRGYGRSAGRPTKDKLVEDFSYFIQESQRRLSSPALLVFHGRSIGGGVLSELTRFVKPNFYISESSFTSLSEVAWDHYRLPSFFIVDDMKSLECLLRAKLPTLIFHGLSDEIISVKHARKMRSALTNSIFVGFEGGHNSGPPDVKQYWNEIFEFLSKPSIFKPPE